jgi:hypothetical protein
MTRFIYSTFYAAFFSLTAGQACASTLTTPSFVIEVKVNCAEGNVTCDNVTYIGTSKKTGKSITLRGRTKHSLCADGVTPCGFEGYEFQNGKAYYQVLNAGTLLVMQDQKVLVEEKGSWDCVASCHAESCKFSEKALLGDWKAVSKTAPFEVMSFESDQEGKHFNSWLHERPDFLDGSWSYENCVLHVGHVTEKDLSYEFVVGAATRNSLVLRERKQTAELHYKRIVETKR